MVDVLKGRLVNALTHLTGTGQCRIRELTWPSLSGVGWHQYEVTIQGTEGEFVGHGTSGSEDIAIIKAFMEAVERSYLATPDSELTNSSGLSAHFDSVRARDSALNESIERDAFLCHFLTRTSFHPMHSLELRSDHIPFFDYLGRNGIQLHVREMTTRASDRSAVVLIAEDLRPGTSCGVSLAAACEISPPEAFEKALLEISGSIAHYLKTVTGPAPSRQLDPQQWGPSEHGAQLHDPAYWSWFKGTYLATTKPRTSVPITPDSETYASALKSFKYSPEFLPDFTVELAIARSVKLQPLYFGPLSEKNANLVRLSEFLGRTVNWIELEKRHHPFP